MTITLELTKSLSASKDSSYCSGTAQLRELIVVYEVLQLNFCV